MPSRGNYWVKGGLPDKTVTEADLGPTLADKINAGGGGGATVDLACFRDEFLVLGLGDPIFDKYNTNGTFIPQFGVKYGVAEMDSGSVSTEGSGRLTTGSTFRIDPTEGDSSIQIVPIPESNQQFHYYGWSTNDLDSVVDVASISATSMYGFMHDPAINNNWQAISRSSSVNTIVDTGLAVQVGVRNKLEAIHDKDAGTITYTIGGENGEVVATISTNIPDEEIFMVAYASNVVATQRSMFIDFWQGMAERIV